ncbi:Aorsin [Cladobotryum mycophilum]|uniref:tripeptidyl-peptidase II n=1 Tax=Cladobotryum mycophilum TaxID=491253 RepID=A0ABR0SJ24_9HYPO
MGLSQFIVYGALAASVVAASPFTNHVTHEKRDAATQGHWIKRDRLSPKDVLPMRIGLTQRNLHRGHDLLMDVSDPSSKNYGKYWTRDQVAEMFSPSKDTVDAVKDWLSSSGISGDRVRHSAGNGWVTFDATAEEAEDLLQTRYFSYEHEIEGRSAVGADEYKIPKHMQDHVDFIHPGVSLLKGGKSSSLNRRSGKENARQLQRRDSEENSCYDLVTPDCVQKLYQVPPGDKAAPGNALGLFESGTWYSPTALDAFFANFTPHIPKGTRPANVSIDISAWFYDDVNTSPPEADLDVQMAFPLVYPQNITIYQADDQYYTGYGRGSYLGWFQSWLDAVDGSYCNYTAFGETGNDPKIDPQYPDHNRTPGSENSTSPVFYQGTPACGTVDNTNVYSLSYGMNEGMLPTYYIYRQCNEFMKLGLMGTTVVAASGDAGTAPNELCNNADYYHTVSQYPSNCPYVLSVGATMLTPDLKEEVANIPKIAYASSGGFSYNYTRPSYQDKAVEAYNQKYNKLPKDAYNATGRAFPDVSALGWNLAMIWSPYVKQINGDGTSASAPIVASIINRINEERLAVGKKPVGFVNPVFYENPGMFNDVVSGNNSVCGSLGYNATPGWDPATGLGTPNYPKMLKVFMDLP